MRSASCRSVSGLGQPGRLAPRSSWRGSTPRGISSAGRGRGPGLPTSDSIQWALEQWRDTFHTGSYTTLVMLDFLIRKRGVTHDDYLRKRSVILDQNDSIAYKARLENDIYPLA